jgi:hypothetical protein
MKNFLFVIIFVFCISQSIFCEEVTFKASISKDAIKSDVIVYNLSNGKAHRHDCEWAEKCTKNCIYIDKEEMKGMFFIPCAVCGGYVLEPIEEKE